MTDDHALEVLLDVHGAVGSEVDESLLRDCYKVEKLFQYDKNRDVPLHRLRRLIEQFVDKELANGNGSGAA